MSTYIDNAINWANTIANNSLYEYSMDGNKRWGQHSSATPPWYYDCSSFVASAYTNSGYGVDFTQNYTTYTGNMYSFFTSHGFKDVTAQGQIIRGDVLLSHIVDGRQHTCIYIGESHAQMSDTKLTVQAIGRAYGIQTNYNDSSIYQYILRLNVTPATWHAKETGGYNRTSTEAIENAQLIYSLLSSKGWTLNAVCGVLGNMESESGYNPWRWQGDRPLNNYDDYRTQNAHAYGLVQFDPASKYIDHAQTYSGYNPKFANTSGSPEDGNAQMLFINEHADYYPTTTYNLTYEEYKHNTNNASWNARAWFYNYERGTWDAGREDASVYWYEVLSGYIPPPPPPPPPPIKSRKGLPAWLLMDIKNKNTKGDFKT